MPYLINNDGTLSRLAAEMLFTNLIFQDDAGRLPRDIFVLELGIGTGLFARLFLDEFRKLCRDHERDYYLRLRYIAADRSERMLRDAIQRGLFASHPGRYMLCRVDALYPCRDLNEEAAHVRLPQRPFQAVFLNYLLDCLPTSVLDATPRGVRQLCVRTCVARGVALSTYTDRSLADLKRLAASSGDTRGAEFMALYGAMSSQYRYLPVDLAQMPYGAFAGPLLPGSSGRLLHSYGAIQCLEGLLDLLHEQGFILVNDYGPGRLEDYAEAEHQRFSQATFIGVNFALLKTYFAAENRCKWLEPTDGRDDMQTRLLGHNLAQELVDLFLKRFRKASFEWLDEPVTHARGCIRAGRLDTGLSYYRIALERQPTNWVLMGETAYFLHSHLRDCRGAIQLAKLALDINPIASRLWVTLADALNGCGHTAEAREAYLRALDINSNEIGARLGLASIHVERGDFVAALRYIADGLAVDRTGQYTTALLHRQHETLQALIRKRRREAVLIANHIGATVSSSEEAPESCGADAGHN